jgi:hypothetical protein
MNSLTAQLAAVMASTDAVPRVIQQFPALFLVTPQGIVWRVFDSEDVGGTARVPSASDSTAPARVFMTGGTQPVVRVHLFTDGESHSIAADKLYEQMTAASAPA